MTVEQRLRDVMRANDTESPTVVAWPPGAGARRHAMRGRVLAAACLVAAVIAGGTWLMVAWPRPSTPATTETPASPAAPLTCPADRAVDDLTGDSVHVPAPPTVPGAQERLVPDAVPVRAVVCGYVTSGAPDVPNRRVALSESAAMTDSDLRAISTALADLPGASNAYGCTRESRPTDDDAYLIGLTYPTGILWVAAPGDHCAGTGNGAFRSSTNIFARAAKWLADGTP